MVIPPHFLKELMIFIKLEKALLTTSKVAKVHRGCQEYILSGGFPEAQLLSNKREYIKSVYEKVLLGDIIEREKVNNKMALRLMIKKKRALQDSIFTIMDFCRCYL